MRRHLSNSTERAYATDWAAFTSWCVLEQVCSLPAELDTVLRYLTAAAGRAKVSSLRRRLVAIRRIHRQHGHALPVSDPAFHAAWLALTGAEHSDTRRRRRTSAAEVNALIASLPPGLAGTRDRALILTVFATGCRPSEVVGLDIEAVKITGHGMVLVLHRTRGAHSSVREITVNGGGPRAYCAVRWMKAWLAAAQVTAGPVFRAITRHGKLGASRLSIQAVRIVLRRAAVRAGISEIDLCPDGLRLSVAGQQP